MEQKEIQDLVEKIIEEKELEGCFFVDFHYEGNKLEVFVDKDGGISFGTCKSISRGLEEVFDGNLRLGEKYILDVSSPGVGRPLKLKRQYVNNVGRNIKIKLADHSEEGKLTKVEDDGVTITFTEITREKKKKIKTEKELKIPFSEIVEAKIKVSFK